GKPRADGRGVAVPGLGDVALPSAPYYRVPEPQQERVALLPRSEVRARAVEKAGRDLVATVHHVVEEHALGVVDILRTQDHEVGAVVDHAARIERGERRGKPRSRDEVCVEASRTWHFLLMASVVVFIVPPCQVSPLPASVAHIGSRSTRFSSEELQTQFACNGAVRKKAQSTRI